MIALTIDSDIFLEINIETELNEVINEINKHATVKNSDKLKLRRAIKKLQQNAKNEEEKHASNSNSETTQNQSDISQNKRECKTDVVGDESKNNNNDNNDKSIDAGELHESFECDVCEKNMSECNLYYCILCNQAASSLDKRKYYCSRHILSFHQEHKKCEKHRDLVVKEMEDIDKIKNVADTKNNNAIQKLTFDVAMIEASKKESLKTVQKSIVKYLNECSVSRCEKTRMVAQASIVIPPLAVRYISSSHL